MGSGGGLGSSRSCIIRKRAAGGWNVAERLLWPVGILKVAGPMGGGGGGESGREHVLKGSDKIILYFPWS
jgi:hypothetical protein